MNRQMRKLVEDDPSYLGLVHGGDYVYSGKSCTDWTEWLTDHQEVITKDSRVIPIVPTFGNHENGGRLSTEDSFHILTTLASSTTT